MLVSRNQLPLMAGGSIFNTWQFAFQYGGLKHTHNKNKTQLKTVIILDCLEGNIVREASEYPGAGRQACIGGWHSGCESKFYSSLSSFELYPVSRRDCRRSDLLHSLVVSSH